MSREIDFRAWDKITEKMYHVAMLWPGAQIGILQNGDALFSRSFTEVELMQSTGLQDRTGRKIYKGDILGAGKTIPYQVLWDEESLAWAGKSKHGMRPLRDIDTRQVIGNIYEQSELVK